MGGIIKAADVLDLGDHLSGGGIADTGNGNEQVSLLLEVRMLIEMISDLTLKISDLGIEESDMLLDGLDDSGGRNARLKAIALLCAYRVMIRDVESSFAVRVRLEEAVATDQDSGYDKNQQ